MPSFSWRLWLGLVLILPSSLAAGEASSLLQDWHDVWLFRFFLNVLGYTTIIIPGYFLITYLKRINYLQTGRGIFYPVIKACVFGSETKTGLLDDVSLAPRNDADSGSSARQAFKLVFCAAGLQVEHFLHSLTNGENTTKYS
ncbi:unnamed protein product [Oncorhynchus mykiss]|uniref:Uncharacterized protein n=1 Tax=Oncorhynchus mykiss TaxID=8022 RepID=A0A060XES4_ONCMY|nr:unnamed protein product [Oncorhynchus mykiss]